MRLSVRAILFSLLFLVLSPARTSDKKIVREGPDLNLPFSPGVMAGDFIYLSGALATDASGRIIAGGVAEQTKQVIENQAQVLRAAGSGLGNVASVHVYLKNTADFAAMNEVYRTYWPADPPARTTVASDLVLPEALVEMSMVAIPAGRERTVVSPPGWMPAANPYSYGILSGDTLFLAGLVPRHPRDNSVVSGDMRAQTRRILENAGDILRAAGMTHADIVSSRVYITDTEHFQEMNVAYRDYFPRNPPARATVKAALMNPRFSIEITLIAVKGADRSAILTPAADGSPGRPNPNLSPAMRVGNRLYLSGMLGNNEGNRGDIRGQTRETLARLGRTLRAAGFEWSHVVDGVVYLTDVRSYAGMNEAYRETFGADFPARATVVNGLVSADALVEIMLTAVR